MVGQSDQKTVVVNIELGMKVVIDIPEPVPKLIKSPVGTSNHKPTLIGKFHPPVVGNQVIVVAGVAVEGNDQRCVGLNVVGNMNSILPAQPIVLERDVLTKSSRGQKKDDGNRGSHVVNIIHPSNCTTEITSIDH